MMTCVCLPMSLISALLESGYRGGMLSCLVSESQSPLYPPKLRWLKTVASKFVFREIQNGSGSSSEVGFGNRLASCKKGPSGCFVLITTKFSNASTGHTSASVRPRMISAPFPSWSHLDCFKCIWTIEECAQSSMDTSPHAR